MGGEEMTQWLGACSIHTEYLSSTPSTHKGILMDSSKFSCGWRKDFTFDLYRTPLTHTLLKINILSDPF